MRILGIDPGYGKLGYALIVAGEGGAYPVETGIIETKPQLAFPKRLRQIRLDLGILLAELKPDVVAMESFFFGRNTTTAVGVAGARGIILDVCADLPIKEYNISKIKLCIAGHGQASKPAMIAAVNRILGLNQFDAIKQDDAADAAAIALTHWRLG